MDAPVRTPVSFLGEQPGGERAKTYQWQLEEDVKTLLERGELDGAAGRCPASFARAVPQAGGLAVGLSGLPSPCPPTPVAPGACCP